MNQMRNSAKCLVFLLLGGLACTESTPKTQVQPNTHDAGTHGKALTQTDTHAPHDPIGQNQPAHTPQDPKTTDNTSPPDKTLLPLNNTSTPNPQSTTPDPATDGAKVRRYRELLTSATQQEAFVTMAPITDTVDLAFFVDVSKAGAHPAFKLALMADGAVRSTTEDDKLLFEGHEALSKAAGKCQRWGNGPIETIGAGKDKLFKLGLWCNRKDDKNALNSQELIFLLKVDDEGLGSTASLKVAWAGLGGSIVTKAERCTHNTEVQFKPLDAKQLEKTQTTRAFVLEELTKSPITDPGNPNDPALKDKPIDKPANDPAAKDCLAPPPTTELITLK